MSGAAPSARAAAAAKAKRDKKILAVSAVILLALMGFELPKLMGGSKTADAPLTPEVTAPAGGTPGSPASPLASDATTLPDTDRVTVQVGSDQLISFGLFRSKDPFVQQLSTNPTSGSPAPAPATGQPTTSPTGVAAPTTPGVTPASPAGSSAGSSGASGGATPVTTPAQSAPFPSTPPSQPGTTPAAGGSTPPAATTPSSAAPTTQSQTSTTSVVAPTAVPITTNGNCENVSLNGTFPANDNIFKLVAIAKNGKSSKISIVGGAYDNGQAATTLDEGVKVTLVNTADGTRYVIEQVAKCSGQPAASGASAGTSTGTSGTSGSGSSGSAGSAPTGTVAAPTVPTSTSTTPIVTDLLDALSPVGK